MPSPHFLAAAISGVVLSVVSSSCVTGPSSIPHKPKRVLHEWYDDGGEGKVAVKISLADQIADFERGGRDIGWCYVATGKEGHSTTPGTYKITEKIEDKYSNRYGWIEDEFGNVIDGDAKPGDSVPEGARYVPAPMPFWMRLTSYGIGMHGGLIPEPGKPASHGCIRLPKEFVPVLFDSVDVGTPVTITQAPSKHATRMQSAPDELFQGDRRVIATRPLSSRESANLRAKQEPRRLMEPFQM